MVCSWLLLLTGKERIFGLEALIQRCSLGNLGSLTLFSIALHDLCLRVATSSVGIMNRRTSCSVALLLIVLLCAGLEKRCHAQDGLAQEKAGDGAALSVVQWVKPRTAGVLKGDIFAPVLGGAAAVVDDAVVVLRGKDGWVGEGETNRLGRFTVTDVKPGAYSLMVKAPGLFAFYALQIAAENDVDAHTYPERATVSCAFIEETAVNRLAKHVEGELTLEDVEVAPEGLGVVQSGIVPSSSVVMLTEGKLSGVLHQAGSDFVPAVGEEITLLRDDVQAATGVTGEKGQFEIAGLDAGVYAFVAQGKSGVAVVGIELRNADGGQADVGTHSENRFVSNLPLQEGENANLSLQVAPNTLNEASEPPAEPTRVPMVAGVGGGSGGGGTGGGGAAAAILAAAAAGAAINDGGGSVIASPAIVAE